MQNLLRYCGSLRWSQLQYSTFDTRLLLNSRFRHESTHIVTSSVHQTEELRTSEWSISI